MRQLPQASARAVQSRRYELGLHRRVLQRGTRYALASLRARGRKFPLQNVPAWSHERREAGYAAVKILTVCSWGCVRSVGLSILLKEKYGRKDVIAAGIDNTTPETFAMLAAWADKVIVVGEQGLLEKVKPYCPDAILFDIGVDVYNGNARHPDLVSNLEHWLAQGGVL